MAATIAGTTKFNLDMTYSGLGTASGRASRLQLNASASVTTVPDVSFSYGTGVVLDSAGAIPINDIYAEIKTVPLGSDLSITVNGGSDTNPFGVALAFTKIKYAFVGIMSPTGLATKKLLLGPVATANAAALWFGTVGASVYEEVYWRSEHLGPAPGWTVNSTTASIFYMSNPGAANISALIVLAGTK